MKINKSQKLAVTFLLCILFCVAGCSQMFKQTSKTSENNESRASLANDVSDDDSHETASMDAAPIDGTQLNAPVVLSNLDGHLSVLEELSIGEDKYLIHLENIKPVLNVMKLSNPPRLVIDVLGAKSIASQEVKTSDLSEVSNIRIGSHSEKMRVVLDLKSEEALASQSVESSGNDVMISIPVSEASKPKRVAMLSSQLNSRAQLAPETNNNVVIPTADLAAVEPTDVELNNTVEDVAAKSEKTSAREDISSIYLKSVKFTKSSNSAGEVALSLSTPVAFELLQSAQSEYVLSLPGVKPDDSVLAPLISAKGEEGIRSVRVVEENNKTLVRFFIDAGVTLSAIPRDEQILIKPASSLASRNTSSRAQLAEGGKVDENVAKANPTGLRSSDGSKTYTGRLISLDLQDTDIDNALRIIAEVSNLNIIASEDVSGKVTLRLIDVPWDQALDVILKTNGLDQVSEGNVIRIAPVDKLRLEREALRESKRAQENLEDLAVQYVRISYARAEDVKPKVEAVLSERGSVTADERTNQLIIKDIQSGQKQALDLLKKLDLRTPQILLETQIVEGSRNILRDLGFQWNFSHLQSPATGNATGVNFPNTVSLGGGTADTGKNPWAVNFPSVIGSDAGSAVTAILDSADGSRMVAARLSALEQEGKAKIVSKPQVATINNKQAKISSVTTIRIRTPSAGTTVATGSGSTASGGGAQAFQVFHVGIELEVTPQASPDYYVLMDIDATSSSFAPREAVDGIPATIERKATSSILVKSGQTFALGGVYRIEDSDAVNGVPFLKDIPFLGAAFRQSLTKKTDEELIFFITPHIVEGSFDDLAM